MQNIIDPNCIEIRNFNKRDQLGVTIDSGLLWNEHTQKSKGNFYPALQHFIGKKCPK